MLVTNLKYGSAQVDAVSKNPRRIQQCNMFYGYLNISAHKSKKSQ